MKDQQKLYDNVIHYLDKLGYGAENIQYEVLTVSNRRVDMFVQYPNGSIAIEVKEYSDIFNLEASELGYHPIVRILQQHAIDLRAAYYIVSDGYQFLWFRTGPSGRPVMIDPVRRVEDQTGKLKDSEYLIALLDHVSSFLEYFPLYENREYDFSLALYAKLCNDLEIPIFDNADFNQNSGLINEVLSRWSDLNFLNFRTEILDYIDGFIARNKHEWQVPQWLGDFVTALYPPDSVRNNALDLFARHGAVFGSLNGENWKHVDGIYVNKNHEYWLRIRGLLNSGREPSIHYMPDLFSFQPLKIGKNYDGIFFTPPFGMRLQPGLDGVDFLLEKALEISSPGGTIIVIIPNGYLFSGRKSSLRSRIGNSITVKGIIDLPNDTFKPQSSVSTSILILENSPTNNQKSFFGRIEKNTSNISNDVPISQLLKNWRHFCRGEKFVEDGATFEAEIVSDNLHFSHYWLQKFDQTNELEDGFHLMPLTELIHEIRRGNNINQKSDGTIAFLAPASVRQMQIIDTGLSYTNPTQIERNFLKVKRGDIIINIIGTHRGNAAIVNESFDGLYLNHHLVYLRPNTNNIIPEYLAIVLNSNFVQQQFSKTNSASVIPSLNLKSFERLSIPVPSAVRQGEIAKNYFQLSEEILKNEKELNLKKQQLGDLLNKLGKETKS